nr:hypothetical protein CFP56_01524 [Quercus suber]
MEDNTHTTMKNSFASAIEGGNGSIVSGSTAGPMKLRGNDQGSTRRASTVRPEKKQAEITLRDGDCPTRVGQTSASSSMAHAEPFTPPIMPSHELGSTKLAEDALSLVGQKAQEVNELMDVSSPIKPTPLPATVSKPELRPWTTSTGQAPGKKPE